MKNVTIGTRTRNSHSNLVQCPAGLHTPFPPLHHHQNHQIHHEFQGPHASHESHLFHPWVTHYILKKGQVISLNTHVIVSSLTPSNNIIPHIIKPKISGNKSISHNKPPQSTLNLKSCHS